MTIYTNEPPTSTIQEKKNPYIKHDQLFKELIHNFFGEFLEVFFPQVHQNIDLSSLKPLSEELYTNLLDGENRRIDIAIETKLKGQDTLIIVHIEPQSTYQKDFNHVCIAILVSSTINTRTQFYQLQYLVMTTSARNIIDLRLSSHSFAF